jgi:transposase
MTYARFSLGRMAVMAGTIASLLPEFPDFDITAVTVATEIIGLGLRPTSASTFCPVCHQPTTKIHGRYPRTLADCSVHQHQLLLRVTARKFVCAKGVELKVINDPKVPAQD